MVARLTLLFGSVALLLGVGELALRAVYGGAAPYLLARIVRHDGQLGWALVPGVYEFFNTSAFTRVTMSINELGLREGPLSLRPEPPRRRVTVLGDSFVFSEGLTDGTLFTDDLERRLGPDCEVVNAGVPGYGTGQEVLLVEALRARGFDLGSTVVLVFFTNDPSDNAGLSHTSLDPDPRRPRFDVRGSELLHSEPEPWPVVPFDAISSDVARRSLLAALLTRRIEILAASNPWIVNALARVDARVPVPRPPGVILAWYTDAWEDRWARTARILSYLADRIESDGAELLIAFQPSPFQVLDVFRAVLHSHGDEALYAAFLDDIDRPQRALLEFCTQHDLRCIDLTPSLREASDRPVFFLNEGHLNQLGSSLVARALEDALRGRC